MLTLEILIIQFAELLNRAIPFIIALTLLFFLWNMFRLVISSNEDVRKEAIKMITFGIIALFVMVSVWGLVNILIHTFNLRGLNTSRVMNGPGVPQF
jgi:VIT1/CCC1 family predicted Fe2+/Mn2+ transporter